LLYAEKIPQDICAATWRPCQTAAYGILVYCILSCAWHCWNNALGGWRGKHGKGTGRGTRKDLCPGKLVNSTFEWWYHLTTTTRMLHEFSFSFRFLFSHENSKTISTN
jgi:hypothetical protein